MADSKATNRVLESALRKLSCLRDPNICDPNPKYDHLPVMLERREGRAILERIDGLQKSLEELMQLHSATLRDQAEEYFQRSSARAN